MQASSTTVEIQILPTKELLRQFKLKSHSKDNDEAVRRALELALSLFGDSQAEFYIDVIFVGKEYAKTCEQAVIFQVGNDPPRYYRYLKGKIEQLDKLPKIAMVEWTTTTG